MPLLLLTSSKNCQLVYLENGTMMTLNTKQSNSTLLDNELSDSTLHPLVARHCRSDSPPQATEILYSLPCTHSH